MSISEVCHKEYESQMRGVTPTIAVIVLLVSTALMGCSDKASDPGSNGDHIVAGVNLTELFAPPTPDEIGTILEDWEGRISPTTAHVSVTSQTTLNNSPYTVRLVSFEVSGAAQWGVVAFPTNADPASMPVLVYCHGGDEGVDVNDVFASLPFVLGAMRDDFVYVIPAFRSEPLTLDGITHSSSAQASPWEHDVDDALALLEYAILSTPAIDSARVGAVGISRGACVAMLMAGRDSRVDLVVEFFGPTDFFGEFAQEVFEDALLGSLRDLPGLTDLNEQIVQPLKNGTLAMSDARLEILRRSPVYFVDQLPPTQAHHGTADAVVPVGEAQRLAEVLDASGLMDPDYHVYIYSNGGHDPFSLSGSLDRLRTFLERLTTPIVSASAP